MHFKSHSYKRPPWRHDHDIYCRTGTCQKKHRSIFFKLLFILIVMALLVHLVVGWFFSLFARTGDDSLFEKNLDNYAFLMARQIGSPPDTILAINLSQTYHFDMVYESADMQWATDDRMPSMQEIHSRRNRKPFGLASYWRHGFLIRNDDGSHTLISWPVKPVVDMPRQVLFLLLFLLSLIFIGAHVMIRRALIPVHWLQKGVDQLSRGDLNVTIPVRRNDELGRLSEAFNKMVKQIREMIESRDQLLLDVSHELRSPITRMRLALEFLPESDKKEDIIADLKALETMITEILESERLKDGKQRLKLDQKDLVQLVRIVAEKFEGLPPGIHLLLPEKQILTLDEERIKIVIRNCLDNAIKYSRKDSKPVQISLQTQKNMTSLSIHDDGIGVPEDVLPHLFEPFYRVDRSRSKETGGYGLGLHMCQKIMEAHEGKIEIRNHPEGGVELILQFKNDLS